MPIAEGLSKDLTVGAFGRDIVIPNMTSKRRDACAASFENSFDDAVFVMGGITYHNHSSRGWDPHNPINNSIERPFAYLKSCEMYQQPYFYSFLLLAQRIRSAIETDTIHDTGIQSPRISVTLSHVTLIKVWKNLSMLPWDIVVHVVRFLARPTVKSWRPLPDMTTKRALACAVAFEGAVIVMGGDDGTKNGKSLSSCEMYQHLVPPNKNIPVVGTISNSVHFVGARRRWRPIPDMITKRAAACAVALEGAVIVMGGYDGSKTLSSCEMYHSRTRKWCRLPDMTTARSYAYAVTLNGSVIVMGGQDKDKKLLKSCEMYYPSDKQWHPLPDMRMVRKNFYATTLHGNKIILIGGITTYMDAEACGPLLMPTNAWELYDPLAAENCPQWDPHEITGAKRWGACAGKFDHRVIVMGGLIEGILKESCDAHAPLERLGRARRPSGNSLGKRILSFFRRKEASH